MRSAILSLLCALAALVAITSLPAPLNAELPSAGQAAPPDDGWRRTTRGWEHVSAWQSVAFPASLGSNTQARIDRVCALVLILCGFAGAIGLLVVEIDPIEFNAFRVWTRR